VNSQGIGLRPVPVPQHVYDRLINALRECVDLPLPVETLDRVSAALGFARSLVPAEQLDPDLIPFHAEDHSGPAEPGDHS